MRRRQLIITGGGFLMIGCTGTSGDDQTTDQSTPTAESVSTETASPTSTPEPTHTAQSLSDDEAFNSLNETAERLEVEIVYTFIGDDRAAFFEYIDAEKTQTEREDDVREFSDTYLSLVEQGWDSEWLEASLIRENETIIFSWLIEPKWVESYLNDEMTKTEIAEEAVETII